MTQRPAICWPALMFAVCFLFGGQLRAADKLQFNRDIRPILSDRCFKCHGPDKASRKAGLRLDMEKDAFAERKGHTFAIVPGKPQSSLVVEKIFATNDDDRMPPKDSHLSLTIEEKQKIRRWIAEGGKYQPYWAFIPLPDSVAVPKVKNKRWPRNEIDRFILARLESSGLKPSPEAGKARWLRRVTYDLIGLPPKPEEMDAFLHDTSTNAYETVVDRLLASKHFGERMAVPWLDSARYADSYGYQNDLLCNTWPYRDWVVNAFNQNLSYDRFITEQLAGDLLPNSTKQDQIATAFNRLHRMTGEGGSIEEEWRNEYVSDRVQTFSAAFLGLTVECARCHDHKFDPILQRDYYSFGAFFNSIDEYGLYNDAAHVPTPTILLPNAEQEKAMESTTQQLREKENALSEATRGIEPAFQNWLQHSNLTAEIPGLVAHFSFDAAQGDHQIANMLHTNELSSSIRGNSLVHGKSGQALRFSGDDEWSLPDKSARLDPWDQYTILFWLNVPKDLTNAVIFHRTQGTDTGFFGTELLVRDGKLFVAVKRFWPGNAIAIASRENLPLERWVQVGVSFDGSGNAEGMRLFVDGEPAVSRIVRDHLFKSPANSGGNLSFGARFRSPGLKGGMLDELLIYNRALAPVEIRQLHDRHALQDAIAQTNQTALRDYYIGALAERVAQARAVRSKAVKNWLETRDPILETSIMQELPEPRPAYLLARGRYDAPKNETTRVSRGTPSVLPAFSKQLPQNRLGLARWLTEPHHPLTARVAVNRYWQMLFGRGIVATTENFGVQGTPPTHPELLDWLARDYVNSGWDTKALLKKIVLSATYRQDSKLRQDLQEKDPENLLLARGPSQRLPAEMIRDTALAASGLLSEKMGGPPVSPYLPGDLWRESNVMSPAYQQSKGENLYRRSIYTVWKRTSPMPDMTAFDAPSREVCVVKRNNTSSPQQAFVLLNDTQFVEACRVLAEKALRESGDSSERRIRFIFRRLTAREPDVKEMKLLKQLLTEQAAFFGKESARAEKLASIGEHERDKSLNAVDVAATTALAQAILNLDATIWKR